MVFMQSRQFFLGSLPGSLTIKLVSRWVPGAGTTKILLSSSVPRAGVSNMGTAGYIHVWLAVSKKHPTLVFNPPDRVPAQH